MKHTSTARLAAHAAVWGGFCVVVHCLLTAVTRATDLSRKAPEIVISLSHGGAS